MKIFSSALSGLCVATLIAVAPPVMAESAPVYDVDTMSNDYSSDAPEQDSAQTQVSPAAPAQQDSGFVPAPSTPSSPTIVAPSLSLGQRMQRVETQITNIQNSDNTARMSSMQEQIQTLRAEVETLTHQLQQTQTQLKSMYTDLDKRLSQQGSSSSKSMDAVSDSNTDKPSVSDNDTAATKSALSKANSKSIAKLSTKAALKKSEVKEADASTTPAVTDNSAVSSSSDGQPNVAEEQQIYQTAYNLIKAKKYTDAVTALQGMLKKYPSGQFASNAHYWLGELYGLMNKNEQAQVEFDTVVKNYPQSSRVSDAQLKVGLIYASQLKWPQAKSSFKTVLNRYPGTASARVAAEQLKQIKSAGH